MDPRVMELRIKKWIPVIEEQAKSGMSKKEWCVMHGINRTSFFRWQKRPHSTHHLSHLIMKCILLNFPLHRISLRKCQDNGVRKQSRPAVPALPSASGAGASP